MITIVYKPSFIRQYKKLEPALQDEIKEKINIFQKDPTHPSLKSHKLKGKLKGSSSFSVNYRYRIIFEFETTTQIALLAVGDHAVYL